MTTYKEYIWKKRYKIRAKWENNNNFSNHITDEENNRQYRKHLKKKIPQEELDKIWFKRTTNPIIIAPMIRIESD